jgi:acetoacetate decarboxylase
MTYPSAPWTLIGYAIQTLQLVDSTETRSFVPSDLDIVSVLPGKTLGGVYLASYGPESVLSYNELIVVSALTRYGKNLGFWISHIYVDHPDSMAGGREIWGLPKELAQFTWQTGEKNHVIVRQGERVLCTLRYGRQRRLWRQHFFIPGITMLGANLLWYKGTFNAQLGLGKGCVDVPSESPFAALGLTRPARTYHYNHMTSVAHAPRVIRHATAPV